MIAIIIGFLLAIFCFFVAGFVVGQDDDDFMPSIAVFIFGIGFFMLSLVGSAQMARKEVRTDVKPVITTEIRQKITGNESQVDTVYIYKFKK